MRSKAVNGPLDYLGGFSGLEFLADFRQLLSGIGLWLGLNLSHFFGGGELVCGFLVAGCGINGCVWQGRDERVCGRVLRNGCEGQMRWNARGRCGSLEVASA